MRMSSGFLSGSIRKTHQRLLSLKYRVKITADVLVPEQKIKPIGLKAKTNSIVFKREIKPS